MDQTVIDDVMVVPGGGRPVLPSARVVLDAAGVVREITPTDGRSPLVLVPAGVDLHLDNLTQRRRPRATVLLDHASVLSVLDAECAAAGLAVVCLAVRCEDSPGKGIEIADAIELARVVEQMAPYLACDWRLHVRVEVTDMTAIDSLREVLALSTRVALVSMMEHSAERTRFASAEENRAFYAADWGVSLEEVDEILAVKTAGVARREENRATVAAMAREAGVALASHDDGTPADVEAGHALGATIAEFPLTEDAARRARELGMLTVLGAPNAVRGRSTAPGNLLAAEAVAAGLCDVLCSDYLPASLLAAPRALDAAGATPWHLGVDLVSSAPARALGLPAPEIVVGQPLTASLRVVDQATDVGIALWRDGDLRFDRRSATAATLTAWADGAAAAGTKGPTGVDGPDALTSAGARR